MSLQKIALSALSLAAVVCIGLAPARAADDAPAAAPASDAAPVAAPASDKAPATKKPVQHKEAGLTKDQVQQMIHDYIMNNPQLIMESVDNYQKKAVADREAHASEDVKKDKDTILKDANSPEAGNPKGDVTVVEFFDYNCHFCKGAFPAIQSLLEKDKNVRVVFKEFPVLGPSSQTAAQWALAAYKQKKYYEFHAAMMNNKEPITDDLLEKVAKSVGMDVGKAKAYVASPEAMAEITKNRVLAEQLDINGTPAFIIGDDISRGAIPEEAMEQKISEVRKGGEKK